MGGTAGEEAWAHAFAAQEIGATNPFCYRNRPDLFSRRPSHPGHSIFVCCFVRRRTRDSALNGECTSSLLVSSGATPLGDFCSRRALGSDLFRGESMSRGEWPPSVQVEQTRKDPHLAVRVLTCILLLVGTSREWWRRGRRRRCGHPRG